MQGQTGQWVCYAARQQGHTSPAPAAETAKNNPSHGACLAPATRMFFFRVGPPCSCCFEFLALFPWQPQVPQSQDIQPRGCEEAVPPSPTVGQLGLPRVSSHLHLPQSPGIPRPPGLSPLLTQLGVLCCCHPLLPECRKPWHAPECKYGSQGPHRPSASLLGSGSTVHGCGFSPSYVSCL